MGLGFEFVIELITLSLPQVLLSLNLSGNQLTSSDIDVIRHCLGISKQSYATTSDVLQR